jgi:hypothetical protein
LGSTRNTFCDSCEIAAARQVYQETAEQQLDELAEGNPKGKRYSFEYLNQCVFDAQQFEAIPPEKLSVTAARMAAILAAERDRIDRVKKWNTPPASNSGD